MTQLRPNVYVSPEVLADAHYLRTVLAGVASLLQHPHRPNATKAAHLTVLEASAAAERLAEQLDALASIQLEGERAEQAHRAEAARLAGVSR